MESNKMKPSNRWALTVFTKTNSKGCWNIAAWHSPHSLTWRWILSFRLFRAGESKMWPLFYGYGRQWHFTIPYIGSVCFQTQDSMYYCDIEGNRFMRHCEELREQYEVGKRVGYKQALDTGKPVRH